MNRKKISKMKREVAKDVDSLSPYDDILCWLKDRIPCPWTQAQIDAFQSRLDSAFGAKDAIVLAWSGDKKYWDEFYTDSHINGLPKGVLEKTPMLLFKKIPVSEADYIYVSAPRWLLLETIHPSQLEASWEADSFVDDPTSVTGKKRIRAERPPKAFYQIFKTIAVHEKAPAPGEWRPCCKRAWNADGSICYGKYRPPSDEDVESVGRMRARQLADGVTQRNDEPREARLLQKATAATNFFIKESERRQRQAVREMIMGDPHQFLGDVIKNYGITMNATQLDRTLKQAFKQSEQENL